MPRPGALSRIDRCPVCGCWRYGGSCPIAAYANHRRPSDIRTPAVRKPDTGSNHN